MTIKKRIQNVKKANNETWCLLGKNMGASISRFLVLRLRNAYVLVFYPWRNAVGLVNAMYECFVICNDVSKNRKILCIQSLFF